MEYRQHVEPLFEKRGKWNITMFYQEVLGYLVNGPIWKKPNYYLGEKFLVITGTICIV